MAMRQDDYGPDYDRQALLAGMGDGGRMRPQVQDQFGRSPSDPEYGKPPQEQRQTETPAYQKMAEGAQVHGRAADPRDPYDVFGFHVGYGAKNPARDTQSEKDYYASTIKPMFDAYGMQSELAPATAAGIHDTIRVLDPRTNQWREVDILGKEGTWWGETTGRGGGGLVQPHGAALGAAPPAGAPGVSGPSASALVQEILGAQPIYDREALMALMQGDSTRPIA